VSRLVSSRLHWKLVAGVRYATLQPNNNNNNTGGPGHPLSPDSRSFNITSSLPRTKNQAPKGNSTSLITSRASHCVHVLYCTGRGVSWLLKVSSRASQSIHLNYGFSLWIRVHSRAKRAGSYFTASMKYTRSCSVFISCI